MSQKVKGINLFPHQKYVIQGLLENPKDTIHTVLAKRQIGKSVMLEQILLAYAFNLKGSISIAISPTNAQNRKIFEEMNKLIQKFCPTLIKKSNISTQEIEFINGSQILFKSAAQKDSLRGYTVSGVLVMDECAYISDDIFYLCLPFTNVHKAPVVLTSTPKFKTGFFYDNYLKGESGIEGYKTYNLNSFDTSLLLSDSKLELYRQQLPKLQFQSEYLGEFIDSDSMVFNGYKDCISDTVPSYSSLYCAIDWANGGDNDDTCVTFMNEKKQLVGIHYINNTSPIKQVDKIISIIGSYKNVKQVTVEENSIGTVYCDILKEKMKEVLPNIKLYKFLTTNKSKNTIIESLIAAIEKKEIQLLNDSKLILQFASYEMTFNPKTMNTSYNAPYGLNDDAVMSIAINYNSLLTKKASYCIG